MSSAGCWHAGPAAAAAAVALWLLLSVHDHMCCCCRVLEGVLRKHAVSPKRVREALHLQHFSDEAARQAAAAADGAAVEAARQACDRAALRSSLRGQLAAGRSGRHAKLQRDEAVHAAILKYQVWLPWC